MKDKNTAGILALIFGTLGFHKFYLGKTGQGILYVLMGLSGILTAIPLILGILEAITYFSNKKEWFDLEYNADYIMKVEMMKNLQSNR